MSSQDVDIDVNVVSSPEPSPCSSPTHRPHSDDEQTRIESHYAHLPHITRHHRPLTITSLTNNNTSLMNNNNTNSTLTNGDSRLSPSKTPPDTPTHTGGSVNNLKDITTNNISTNGNHKNSGFTSFSISSILSRGDAKSHEDKKHNNGTSATNVSITTTLSPITHTGVTVHGAHDAAMLSSLESMAYVPQQGAPYVVSNQPPLYQQYQGTPPQPYPAPGYTYQGGQAMPPPNNYQQGGGGGSSGTNWLMWCCCFYCCIKMCCSDGDSDDSCVGCCTSDD